MFDHAVATTDIRAYSAAINRLRSFFLRRGFVEVHTQDRLSILAACEDPSTVSPFSYAGAVWPLPQTGQMWLEYELLKNPDLPGVFCVSTSFRNEPNPVPGRHALVFPMFEFEASGTFKNLRALEQGLCHALGFGTPETFYHISYCDAANAFNAEILTSSHEEQLGNRHGPVVFLERFPERTSPFWNMKHSDDGLAHKIDVLLHGMETIGSAERSSNPDEMRRRFHTVSGGQYAETLFGAFGRERVLEELDAFLALPFIPRFGGGIGMTRLLRALILQKQQPSRHRGRNAETNAEIPHRLAATL